MSDTTTELSANQANDALTWKPLRLLSFYRVILAGLLAVLFFSIPEDTGLGLRSHDLYAMASLAYLGLSVLAGFTSRLRWPGYELQSFIQIVADIIAITVLMFASGGLESGLGILLLIAVAAGGILLPGRRGYLFAAIAALAVMAEEVYSAVFLNIPYTSGYTQAGLLGVALFITAAVTNLLVNRIKETEALAHRRGIDIANLAKLNAHIVQRLQAGIIVIDAQHRIRLINRTAQQLLHLDKVAIGESLAERSPQLFTRYEEWCAAPDATPSAVPVRIDDTRVTPHFTPLGTADGTSSLIFLEDSAALAKQAQQLKLVSLGRLTASIAHEIRNPLGAISHATQLLDESEDLSSSDERLIAIIGDQSRRVNAVVENVLELSRPGASSPHRIRLRDWLDEFVDELVSSGNVAAEAVELTVEPGDLEVYMDPSLLHQVTWNLCQNAITHGGKDNADFRLRLVAAQPDATMKPHLDIMDNGPGIDPDNVDSIFDPFFTTGTKGTGLGLYIAREICENNQSTLDYLPAADGGSCFRITFNSSDSQAASTFAS